MGRARQAPQGLNVLASSFNNYRTQIIARTALARLDRSAVRTFSATTLAPNGT